jgi:hypothetical protein
MNECLQVLPTAGGNVGVLALVTLMIAGGFVLLRSARHGRNHLMVAALPLISLMTFVAPTTQNADDCPPQTTTSLAPTTTSEATTTTSLAPTTTTVVPTTTTAPGALTVVLLGQLSGNGQSFGPLTDTSASVCETRAPTNCVTFTPNANGAVNATGTIQMSAAGTLTVNTANCSGAILYDASVTPQVVADLLTGTDPGPSLIGGSTLDNPLVTTDDYSNSDVLYIATVQPC